jgi:hypothetical protein
MKPRSGKTTMRPVKPTADATSRQSEAKKHKVMLMLGASVMSNLLVVTFAIYGMISGDRQLLLEVWSLIKMMISVLMIWGGGKGVLQLLSKFDLRE